MRRREFIALLGGAAACWPLGARAQQAIGRGWLVCCSQWRRAIQKLKCASRRLRPTARAGLGGGRNMRLEYRWAPRDPSLLLSHATELIGLGPDVILATGTPVVAALRQGNPHRSCSCR